MAEGEKDQKKRKIPKKIFLIAGIILVVLLIGLSVYYYLGYRKNQELLKNPTLAAQEETQQLVNKIGQHMVLPTDEQPTVAIVSDISKLKGQPFFSKAQNGFRVLIYSKAQKAILYD